MRDFLEFCGAALVFILGGTAALFVALFLFAAAWTVAVDRPICHSWARISQQEVQFEFWAGCMVKTEAGWMKRSDFLATQRQQYGVTIK